MTTIYIDLHRYKYLPLPRVGIHRYPRADIGAGVVRVDRISNGAVIHLDISIVFGTVVTALIYRLGLLARTSI